MATTTMQTLLGSPVRSGVINRNALNQFVPCSFVPSLKKNATFRIRSMSEDGQEEPASSPNPTQPKKKASNPKFTDILAFSGPGPERINGRLAMIGFVTAIGVELAKGQDVFEQLQNGGVLWFIGTSVVLSLASLIPLFRGVSAEAESEGLMTSDAELWNGRFAMIGLVALAFTEYVKGGALV